MHDSILNNKNLLFHGIGYNLFSFIGILKYGIYSKKEANESNNPYFCNNVVGNNYDTIAVSISPSINGINTSPTYKNYIKGNISFVINKDSNINISNTKSLYNYASDVCYIENKIPLDNIIGIMVDENTLYTKISELPLNLDKPSLAYSTVVPKKCEYLVRCMEDECDYMLDTSLLEKYLNYYSYTNVENIMRQYVGEAFSNKLNIENIKLIDVLNYYNVNNITLYNENGFELEKQNVTKK